VAGGNLIVQRALGPVKAVTRAARRITAEDLSLRIVAQHPQDEIGELVATFNDMIAGLERSVDRIRQFSADVSHELRTPLAVVRSEIEVQLRRARSAEEYGAALASVLEETAKLERIIGDLLLLSRVEALGRKGLCAPASLDEAVMAAFESREPLARKKGIAYTLEKVEPASVPGDEGLLERLAANIIDNAVRYTPDGGQVVIALQREGDAAVLRVADTGPGIPEEALPRIFDRFVVVDRSRSRESGGTGLGLSIVKSIADLHGAAVDVRRRPGGGTEFIVRFRTGDASVTPPSASP
jgi:heavy metal sensor kinase